MSDAWNEDPVSRPRDLEGITFSDLQELAQGYRERAEAARQTMQYWLGLARDVETEIRERLRD